jgi:hypothetical protein
MQKISIIKVHATILDSEISKIENFYLNLSKSQLFCSFSYTIGFKTIFNFILIFINDRIRLQSIIICLLYKICKLYIF